MISKRNILNFDTRREIYDFVKKNPGLNIREISRRTKIPRTTLFYHIRFLEKQDIIKIKTKGEYKFIYTSDEMGKEDKEILELLRTRTPCQILLHMYFTISCSQIELSRELNQSPSTISYHLKKMMKMGIIEEAPAEDGIIQAFPAPNDSRIMSKSPKGREIFYRRKNQKFFMKVANVLITHKDSLSDAKYIDEYLSYLRAIVKLRDGKKPNYTRKKVIEKDGKKVVGRIINQEEELYDIFYEIFKPPFCA